MSELNIIEHQAGDVMLLELEGLITFGQGSVALRDGIARQLKAEHKKVLLDLAGVRFIDSTGLGQLIASFASIRHEGGQLKLLRVPKNVIDLMALTKLLTVFEIFDDELTALNSFTLGEDYELIPYDGEVNWTDADEDERLYRWAEGRRPDGDA